MKLIFLNIFHLQTDRNGVHQKGHWGYCNDDLDLGLFVRNADEEEGGDCPIPKTDKPSPKPPTTTTLKPIRRKPSTPKSQTRKPTTQKPLQDYEDYDYDYDYYNEPSPTTTTPKPPQRKTTTHTSPKTKGTLVLNS